jgi:energy-coupling factor transporter ATP-binding protein EcfA2
MPRDMAIGEALRLREISKRYIAGAGNCTAAVTALRRVSIEIRAGEMLVVAGPIGAGKSTLLLCAAGLLTCDTGSVMGMPRRVAYRDLAVPVRPIERITRGAVLLLDTCDSLPELARHGAARLTERSLAAGAAVVVAGRDANACIGLAPAWATVSIVHLRLGETLRHERVPASIRVAEPSPAEGAFQGRWG